MIRFVIIGALLENFFKESACIMYFFSAVLQLIRSSKPKVDHQTCVMVSRSFR